MAAYLDVALTQAAGDDPEALIRVCSFDPKQLFGEAFAESPVDLRETTGCRGAAVEPAGVNPFL